VRIGIDSYSYHRYFGEIYKGQKDPGIRWNLIDFFKHVREAHRDIEAISLETCFINEKEKKGIVSIVKDSDYDVMFAWGHPNGFMDINIDEAVNEITEYVKLTKAIGLKVLRIAASSIAYYERPHLAQVSIAVRVIKRIINVAEEYGVRLALENHGDFHIDEILTILDQVNSDQLGVTFDTGNSLRLHEDCVSAIERYDKKIYLVHAKDVAPDGDKSDSDLANLNCVPAGEGIVDFKTIFSELDKNRYDGMVLIEISRVHSLFDRMDETEIINRGIQYLKDLRGKISE
jgi:sugar phosphate isomerase/epimerase